MMSGYSYLNNQREMDIKWQTAMNQKYQLFDDGMLIVNNTNISFFDLWTSHAFGKRSTETNSV